MMNRVAKQRTCRRTPRPPSSSPMSERLSVTRPTIKYPCEEEEEALLFGGDGPSLRMRSPNSAKCGLCGWNLSTANKNSPTERRHSVLSSRASSSKRARMQRSSSREPMPRGASPGGAKEGFIINPPKEGGPPNKMSKLGGGGGGAPNIFGFVEVYRVTTPSLPPGERKRSEAYSVRRRPRRSLMRRRGSSSTAAASPSVRRRRIVEVSARTPFPKRERRRWRPSLVSTSLPASSSSAMEVGKRLRRSDDSASSASSLTELVGTGGTAMERARAATMASRALSAASSGDMRGMRDAILLSSSYSYSVKSRL
mmetsp:Transcript_2609/g.4466  ORF Transcript_2609/g.4466 Transcript_2609/m.4466 type:complete len:311 (-) Transcript_2609:572-1504(-)